MYRYILIIYILNRSFRITTDDYTILFCILCYSIHVYIYIYQTFKWGREGKAPTALCTSNYLIHPHEKFLITPLPPSYINYLKKIKLEIYFDTRAKAYLGEGA